MATIGENVIVVDHDDDFVRAGYPIPERDPLLQPSLVRRSGGGDGELLRPVVNRRVVDWDQLESVYAHVFYRQLGWVEGDEGAALVQACPKITMTVNIRRSMSQMFAEKPILSSARVMLMWRWLNESCSVRLVLMFSPVLQSRRLSLMKALIQ